jgi:hypothetical protein
MTKVEKLLATGRSLESFSYVWVPVHCGKRGCKRCPHGPYLYARYREGSKIKAIYIGRTVPTEVEAAFSRSSTFRAD